jgi:hypothetical protein
MQRILSALVLVPLASCAIDVYVHDERQPATSSPSAAHPAAVPTTVSGVVHDASGRPVRAHVAAVGASGSISCGTDESGRFELANIAWREFGLSASTSDGQFGAVAGVPRDVHGIELTVRPGATLSIRVDGLASTRCALFQNGTRFEDFTARSGQPASVVVPPGEILVRLYDADTVHAERTTRLEVGDSRSLEFRIDE